MSAHCAAERRPQGTIRQRRIFGIGDASPRCRRRLGCASRAQARGGSLLHHVPNRPPRFPTSTPPPGPSAHPSGFSIRSQQDSIGFNPTAFKAPVRTSVATEFNPGEHEYDTIPARHPSIRSLGNFASFAFFAAKPHCQLVIGLGNTSTLATLNRHYFTPNPVVSSLPCRTQMSSPAS